MRYTIHHVFIDLESDYSNSGFLRGTNDAGYSLSEGMALIMQSADAAMSSQGTMTIKGDAHRGIEEWEEWTIFVTVTTDTYKQSWLLVGE